MDHDFIINTIIKNNGIIIGGYIREWVVNGNPSDHNWKDIDIKCPENSVEKIKKEIGSLYPNLILDFRPNLYVGYKSPYSCDLIQYDGEFKTVDIITKENYLDLIKNKICIYIRKTSVGRKLNREQKLINQGWKIEFPYLMKS
jgi:hypothetical protein